MDSLPVVWEPQEGSQALFLSCPHWEVLYEGTRGPGKTDALIMDFAQHVGFGFGMAWRGILFRQTYKQLNDVIKKTRFWFHRIFPGVRYNKTDRVWSWPDGEELLLSYMDDPEDYWNYHGHEYPWIAWEELTNWPDNKCYTSMQSCNRSSNPQVPRKYRASCNPYGPGHAWVKAHFVDPAPPGVPIIDSAGRTRVRIHGSIYENKILMQNDPFYIKNLEADPDENRRKAWLLGSWDIVAGAYFAGFFDRSKNVITTWLPPKGWVCFRSFDWGSAKPFSVGWWCISDGTEAPDGHIYPRGSLIRFAEWYGCKPGEPNTGLRLTSKQVAKGIVEREKSWKKEGISVYPGPADPAIFAAEDGPSIADNMEAEKVSWKRADNKRKPGWEKLRELMLGEEDRRPEEFVPRLYIMENCTHWIRTVPVLQRDARDPDDVDTQAEDHAADETRYTAMFKGPYIPSKKKHWK